jgi:hypothetical protein
VQILVVLTDAEDKPVSGVAKHHLATGEDARLVASRMMRANRRGRAKMTD